jgi:hypothetical protein
MLMISRLEDRGLEYETNPGVNYDPDGHFQPLGFCLLFTVYCLLSTVYCLLSTGLMYRMKQSIPPDLRKETSIRIPAHPDENCFAYDMIFGNKTPKA